MARRRRDRWALSPAYSLRERARAGRTTTSSHPTLCSPGCSSPDRILEVEARVIAYTERAVLVEWGFSEAAEWAWVWRDAASRWEC